MQPYRDLTQNNRKGALSVSVKPAHKRRIKRADRKAARRVNKKSAKLVN